MVTYGYDRENAEKVYEIQHVRAAEKLFGTVVGAAAVAKTYPIFREHGKSYGLFRKTWMKFPVPLAIFGVAYTVATMLPSRAGRKLSFSPTVSHNTYTSCDDLVGRFRLFENESRGMTGQERELTNYLSTYSTEALTEPEIIAQIEGRNNTMKGKGGKQM